SAIGSELRDPDAFEAFRRVPTDVFAQHGLAARPRRVMDPRSEMILDIFSELQKPSGMAESRLYAESIEQAKLADALGYGCWWTVEHHCTGEFSHCSTPDLFLAVLSQQTKRIRLGTSGTHAPFGIHHPLQIAERAAFLDVISGGRLELGLARS